MSRDLSKYSDDELINVALDYADEHTSFNADFIHSLEGDLDKYDELTAGQREALEKVVRKFRMIE